MTAFLLLCAVGALAMFGIAALIVSEMDMRPMSEQIREAALKGAKSYLDGPEFKALVLDIAKQNPRYQWTLDMASWFVALDRSMSKEDAWGLAVQTTNEMLREANIAFGDCRFAWDAAAARAVADEYQIRFWEAP